MPARPVAPVAQHPSDPRITRAGYESSGIEQLGADVRVLGVFGEALDGFERRTGRAHGCVAREDAFDRGAERLAIGDPVAHGSVMP